MVNKTLVGIVAVLVLITAALWAVLATQTPPTDTAVPGVVTGNMFTYSIKGYTELIGENASAPESYSEINMTDWYRVTITSVSGPMVNFNTSWHFTNGTEIENTGYVNVSSGDDNKVFWAIYPTNLTLNYYVSPAGTDGAIVNETEIRTYASGPRDTNIMTLQRSFVDTTDPNGRTVDDYLYVHFDKATGMLVELKDMRLYSDPEMILTTQWELIDSNVWAVA